MRNYSLRRNRIQNGRRNPNADEHYTGSPDHSIRQRNLCCVFGTAHARKRARDICGRYDSTKDSSDRITSLGPHKAPRNISGKTQTGKEQCHCPQLAGTYSSQGTVRACGQHRKDDNSHLCESKPGTEPFVVDVLYNSVKSRLFDEQERRRRDDSKAAIPPFRLPRPPPEPLGRRPLSSRPLPLGWPQTRRLR
jgi:hypothetical protein